ncbi:MAG: type IV secretory system conjugative DNA transfer family protein [Bacilli bacterium]
MKLKFRADHKDFIAFLWVCLLLLFIVSLGVINIYHIVETEEINRWTFNIIPAFFPPYVGYTISFWLLSILLIVASVSSYFFSREKGFGVVQGKKEDGYGRFAKEDEYKNFKDVEAVDISAKESASAGFPLVYDKKKNVVYVDNGESHSLVIGATGSGKTYRIIHQQVSLLAKKGESMIISDPKGEIYEKHAEMLKDKGYNVIVVNFREPKKGSCWNPYTLPYNYYINGNPDKANELLNDMALNIAIDGKSDDPFWTASAADYLTGLGLGLFEDAKPEQISISSVNLMITVGDQKIGASTYLKEYFNLKDPSGPAAINALGTINAPADTKNSIDSVLKQKIKVFAVTQNLSEMLSRSDFDMEDIGKKKTAVFMIIQDEKTTYHALATIFVKQCYESLISVAQKSEGGKLPVRTNFLLDEFANMPKFKDFTTMITAARSRQIRFTMIIQNFAQLVQAYGKEDAETIRGNCGNILYLLTGELSALEEISKLCGDKIVKVGKDKKEETRPLITVTELQRFKEGEILIIKHRLPPLKTKFPGFWELDFGYGKNNEKVQKAEYIIREQKPIDLFDIRAFVKQKKEEKRAELFGAGNPFESTNPFGGDNNPFGSNPFIGNPFGPNQMLQNSNSISKKESNQKEDTLNIDELVKRIDAQIAQLEAEEERDKKLQEIPDLKSINSDNKNVEIPVFEGKTTKHDIMDDYFEDLSFDVPTLNETKPNKESVSKPDVPNEAKPIYMNNEEINKIMSNEKDTNNESDDDFFNDFFE